jgi:DNA invertase Pin-like site-specific DNA recombinase
MDVGYARVSTDDQTLDLQLDALRQAGCKRIFRDVASGSTTDRSGLAQALDHLREGDTLVVWRLDRLSRTLKQLIELITTFDERGIGFRSLTEQIDTTSSGGKLIFHIFGALAEFERTLIRERTQAGLAAARARGKTGGRRFKLDDRQVEQLRTLYADETNALDDLCRTFNISPATLYRYVGRKPARPGAAEAPSSPPTA